MRSRGDVVRGALAAVGVTGLVACSGAAAPEESEAADPFAPGPFSSHVLAEIGEDQDALIQADHARQEAVVARCMTDAGFEYTPATDATIITAFEDVEQWEEDLRSRGWGYFTEAGSAGEAPEHEPTAQDEYVESLSPEARAEYERALFGEFDPATGEPVAGAEGCHHEAHFGEDPSNPESVYADLLEEVRGAWEVAEADPELVEARTDYRECMSRAGFPGIQRDAAELLDQRLTEEFPDMSFRSNDPRLVELAAWEVRLANAHLDCIDETGVPAVASRATAKVEAEIMERRAAEVEAYVAALREHVTGS